MCEVSVTFKEGSVKAPWDLERPTPAWRSVRALPQGWVSNNSQPPNSTRRGSLGFVSNYACADEVYIWGSGSVLKYDSHCKSPGICAVVPTLVTTPLGLSCFINYMRIIPTSRAKRDKLNMKYSLGSWPFLLGRGGSSKPKPGKPCLFMSFEESLK